MFYKIAIKTETLNYQGFGLFNFKRKKVLLERMDIFVFYLINC